MVKKRPFDVAIFPDDVCRSKRQGVCTSGRIVEFFQIKKFPVELFDLWSQLKEKTVLIRHLVVRICEHLELELVFFSCGQHFVGSFCLSGLEPVFKRFSV
jgi:hypothetical protein